MRWLNLLITRLRGLFRRDAVLKDIEEELRLHVEIEIQSNIERGMTPDEARLAALRNFGNLGRIKDLAYDVHGGGMLETTWRDLRLAARTLREETSAGGDHGTVIISHDFWQLRFTGDPAVVGKTISIGNETCTVIGVMPAGFRVASVAARRLPADAGTIAKIPGPVPRRAGLGGLDIDPGGVSMIFARLDEGRP